MVAVFGVSFLTPLDALFVLAALLPLAALVLTERRAGRVRRLLALERPRRRAIVPVVVALVLLPALVAVAAAQPVVVRERLVAERGDAQAFVVLDTSLSMHASPGRGRPTRLARAKRLALRLRAALPDLPMGVASMTDRALPNLMPTTDQALFDRVVEQSVAIDQPPPSQEYKTRATTFAALAPFVDSHFFSRGAQRRVVVVFTDGESAHVPASVQETLRGRVFPVFVHVWRPGEQVFRGGRADPRYVADPTSGRALDEAARLAGAGRSYGEDQLDLAVQATRDAVGPAGPQTRVQSYARVALAPWFVLAGVVPLFFLLWRRNFYVRLRRTARASALQSR